MSEKTLHTAVCQYIRYQYPSVLFNSDLSGSMRLTIGQAKAMKALRSSRGFPDITIFEARNGYHGLFIELKAEGEKLLNRQGMPRTPHLLEQARIIERLNDKGYLADFAVGFEEAKLIIDNYMKQ